MFLVSLIGCWSRSKCFYARLLCLIILIPNTMLMNLIAKTNNGKKMHLFNKHSNS